MPGRRRSKTLRTPTLCSSTAITISKSECFAKTSFSKIRGSVAKIGQKALDLSLLFGGKREEGQARTPAIVAIKVAGILDPTDSKIAHDALGRARNAFLLFSRQL